MVLLWCWKVHSLLLCLADVLTTVPRLVNKGLYGEAPPRGPNSHPLLYHFSQKKVPLSYTFIYLKPEKGTSFRRSLPVWGTQFCFGYITVLLTHLVACEQQTYFWSSLLFLQKITTAKPNCKMISVRKSFCFDVGQSDQRIEYGSSDSSRPRALKRLRFRRELLNTLWNMNFATITRVPATLNADFFMKQLLLKLCMWCGPLVSLYKIR